MQSKSLLFILTSVLLKKTKKTSFYTHLNYWLSIICVRYFFIYPNKNPASTLPLMDLLYKYCCTLVQYIKLCITMKTILDNSESEFKTPKASVLSFVNCLYTIVLALIIRLSKQYDDSSILLLGNDFIPLFYLV